MLNKIKNRFHEALIKRRRRFQKNFPFLKHFHPSLVFVFIILFIMTMRLGVLPLFVLFEIQVRKSVETELGYTLPQYTIEVAVIVLIIATIVIIRKSITKHLKSKPIKGETMRAMIYEEYGAPEVFKLTELKKPKQGHDEMLIKVIATSVTAGDINMRGFTYVPNGMKWMAKMIFGFKKPKKQLIGNTFSGVVEAIGSGVKEYKVGDEVFGMESDGAGAYAEYKCITHDKAVVIKPQSITHLEAASIPFGAMTALHFIQKAKLKKSQSVLINGAAGSVGSATLQITKSLGANTTAVCSTHHIDMVKDLGADEVIDYTKTNFHENGIKYDVIINTVVTQGDYSYHKNSLKEGGTYVAIAGSLMDMFRPIFNIFSSQKIVAGVGTETKELLESIVKMVEEEKYKPVIDPKIFTLDELGLAHAHAESKEKYGSVVVAI